MRHAVAALALIAGPALAASPQPPSPRPPAPRAAPAPRVDPAAVLRALTASAAAAAHPFGQPALGIITWSRVEGGTLKAKLALPLEGAAALVRWMATDPAVSFASSTFGANAGDASVTPPAKPGAARTFQVANLSLELALGRKDAAADRLKALGFGLARRVLSGERARVKAGDALELKQLELGPKGACHVEARAATLEALVVGLQRLAGEAWLPVPTSGPGAGAPPVPSPVVMREMKSTRLVRDSEDGADGIAVGFDAVLGPAPGPSEPRQGFAAVGIGLELAQWLPPQHADLRQKGTGDVESVRFAGGATEVAFSSTLSKLPPIVKKLEEYTLLDPSALLISLATETQQVKYTDAKGAERWFGVARVLLAFKPRSGGSPKRGLLTHAAETLDRVFTNAGNEFYSPPPAPPPPRSPTATTPAPPPPPPPPPSRPALRTLRITDGKFELRCLFRDAAQLKKAITDLSAGGLAHVTIEKQEETPYRDTKVIEANLLADLPTTP